jgi:hypothetical protein
MKPRLDNAERTEKLSLFSKEKKKAKSDKPSEEKNGWQSEEDDKLLQLVDKSSGLNWSRVARWMGGVRSAEECQLRYEDLSRRDAKKGNWTAEEDQLLRQWVVSLHAGARSRPSRMDELRAADPRSEWQAV